MIIVLYAFLVISPWKEFLENISYAHNHLWRCVSAGKQECEAHFFFLLQFLHYLSIGEKERGKWKKTALNTPCQKKIRKANKKKKIKRKRERSAPVLRTFKYENDDDQDLETWKKPIIFSLMSHEWTLSSPRSLVRRPVEHKKRNSEFYKRPCIILFII